MANRLGQETSPYLRQHADNPVEWYPWGEEAFEVARREDRPVLLSIGYSACHWCHVMAHESFEDESIAALMNELFVSIKVDREERPDVDSLYMQAVQALTGGGGWPMTVFLTPEGVPFHGGTYYPPEDRHGISGFPTVLRAVAGAYHDRRGDVESAGERLRSVLSAPRPRADAELGQDLLEAAVSALVSQSDPRDGGFGAGPKFPHAGALELLMRRHWSTGDASAWRVARLALDRMARGGVFDQVGGGFHRYSVDRRWAVPHFEKMLYDNGLLASLYLHAYQLSGEVRWRRVAEQTLDYLLREMQLPGGGFASSQDADSEGGEGRFFVWSREELRSALGPEDAEAGAELLGVGEVGNFEGSLSVLSLPRPIEEVAGETAASPDEVAQRLDALRARLLEARSRRPAPARDDKVITSWNALVGRALAEAGAVLERPDYLTAARRNADFLLESLVRDGVVQRTWKDGEAKIPGFLEDVSYLADTLLVVYEATGEPLYFTRALELCEDIEARFHVAGEGLYDTAKGSQDLLVRPHTVDDNPLPAGQSVAAHAYLRLAGFTGEDRWRERALEMIIPLAGAVPRAPLAISNLAVALDLALATAREVAVAGDPDSPATQALLRSVREVYDPHRVLAWGSRDGVPLLRDRHPIEGQPAGYVCERFVCQAPATQPDELRRQLAGPFRRRAET